MPTFLNELIGYYLSRIHFHGTHAGALAISVLVASAVNMGVMLIELWVMGWQESSLRRLFVRPSKSAINDIVLFFLVQSSVATFLGSILTLGIVSFFTHQIRRSLAPWQLTIALNPFFYYGLYLLVIDFCNYWNHRLFHKIEFLWEIHKFHHAATEMTVLTATRDHPLERIMGTLFVVLPVALLAPPAKEVALLTLLVAVIGPLKHSGMDWGWGWFGKYVVQSPRAHRIHHSIEPQHHNKNYASIFSFWDHFFATWSKDETSTPAVGIVGNELNHNGTIWDMAHCYDSSLRSVLLSIRKQIELITPSNNR
jgi:sterol desaturase/sphingolipid hydroxylase (fatty acid hydroxylase superfamily)